MSFQTCQEKQEKIKSEFLSLETPEKRYEQIIAMGKTPILFPEKDKLEENRVKGCQSILYLKMSLKEGKLQISTTSDALITAGLAMLLASVYQNEPPEAVLKCPPHFLKEIGIFELLSPMRSNGLLSLFKKMQQDVIKLMVS